MGLEDFAVPGLGLAGDVASGLLSGRNQRKADERNVKFWHQQNKYNSPTEQMARLQTAGLNPNLIYGDGVSGATGQAQAIAPSKAADAPTFDPMGDINKFANTGLQQGQTDNLQAINDVNLQKAALTAAQTAGQIKKTSRDAFDLSLAEKTESQSLEMASEAVRQMKEKTIGLEINNRIQDATAAKQVEEIFYRVENAKSNLTGQNKLNTLRQLEINLKKLGINSSDPLYYRVMGVQGKRPDVALQQKLDTGSDYLNEKASNVYRNIKNKIKGPTSYERFKAKQLPLKSIFDKNK